MNQSNQTNCGATSNNGTNDTETAMTSEGTPAVFKGSINDSPKSERGNDETTTCFFPHRGTDVEAARAWFKKLLESAPGLSLTGPSQVGKSMQIVLTDGDPLCKGCVPSKLDVDPFFAPDNAFAPFGSDENLFAHETWHGLLGGGTSMRRLIGHPQGYVGFGHGDILPVRPELWDPQPLILLDEIEPAVTIKAPPVAE
jgi:hypothetical protein